jgi:zinc transport system substrate-binding protein
LIPVRKLLIYSLLGLLVLDGTGCGKKQNNLDSKRARIATTIHPFATLLRPIVGDAGTVTTLLPPGASPHTYTPRPSDIRTTASSHALVFGEDHLDGWATDIPAPTPIELFPLIPDSLQLPFPPGLASHQSRPEGRDPHFWTDPLTVKALVPALIDKLCDRLPHHCSTFRANGTDFIDSLDTLHRKLEQKFEPISEVTILLATPFFQYFLNRYHLPLAGVIEPVPGKVLGPRTLQEVVQKARNQNITVILAPDQMSVETARTVSRETGIPLHRMDLIGDDLPGRTYTTLILENAQLLLHVLD